MCAAVPPGNPSRAGRPGAPPSKPDRRPTAALDALEHRSAVEAELEHESPVSHRVGWGLVALYALAYMGTWLMLLSPVLVTLALKVNSLVGTEDGPGALSLVAGVGALLAMLGNPIVGELSDRTTSRLGMRRPWMVMGLIGGAVGLLIVALARSIPVVLLGWCLAQVALNALLVAQVAVLPDHMPASQRGTVSGVLGACLPTALIVGSFVVQLAAPNQAAMFLLPVAVGGVFVMLFAVVLKDRRLVPAHKPPWSGRELARTFYVNPRRQPDFAWAWGSRFLFILAFSFLTTYEAFYLLDTLGSAEAEVPQQVFLATLVFSALTVVSSVVGGRLSDATGRRKVFVLIAAVVYSIALFFVAAAGQFGGFLIGMAIAGVGFGVYAAVGLALVADVLPNPENAAKDLGVFNIASTLPQSVAPAIAPAILAIGGGSYSVLFAVAGGVAVLSALAILPVRRVR